MIQMQQSGGLLLAAIISLASDFADLILGVLIDESFGGLPLQLLHLLL